MSLYFSWYFFSFRLLFGCIPKKCNVAQQFRRQVAVNEKHTLKSQHSTQGNQFEFETRAHPAVCVCEWGRGVADSLTIILETCSRLGPSQCQRDSTVCWFVIGCSWKSTLAIASVCNEEEEKWQRLAHSLKFARFVRERKLDLPAGYGQVWQGPLSFVSTTTLFTFAEGCERDERKRPWEWFLCHPQGQNASSRWFDSKVKWGIRIDLIFSLIPRVVKITRRTGQPPTAEQKTN